MTDTALPTARPILSDRLSQWLGWTDAIALASALNDPVRMAAPPAKGRVTPSRDLEQVRSALCKAIADDHALASMAQRRHIPSGPTGKGVLPDATEYASYRQHYQSLQRSMEHAIGSLRERLRARLAGLSPDMAQLAAIDGLLDQALFTQERQRLGRIPALLETHFNQLRQTAQAQDTTAETWLERFRNDMRRVLLTELDVRLQPANGLLAALCEHDAPPSPSLKTHD